MRRGTVSSVNYDDSILLLSDGTGLSVWGIYGLAVYQLPGEKSPAPRLAPARRLALGAVRTVDAAGAPLRLAAA